MGDKVDDVDGRVQSVHTKLEDIDNELQRIDDEVQCVNDKVSAVIEGEVYLLSCQWPCTLTLTRLDGREIKVAIQQVINRVSDMNRL
jgi:hypothetical protein